MKNNFLQFLGLVKRSGNLIEGYNKCEEVIDRNKISLIILSTDCSTNTVDKFTKYCKDFNVSCIQDFSKEELGLSIGRSEVNIVGVTERKMSNKLLEIWNNRNNI